MCHNQRFQNPDLSIKCRRAKPLLQFHGSTLLEVCSESSWQTLNNSNTIWPIVHRKFLDKPLHYLYAPHYETLPKHEPS